jgi:hypothetical protein
MSAAASSGAQAIPVHASDHRGELKLIY